MSGIRHLPRTSSNLKFGNYGLLADQSTLDRLEGYKSGQSQRASEESTYGRSFVSTSSRPGSAREQLLPKTGPRPSSEALPHVPGDIDLADAGRVSEGGSANLQSLYSHRISHAAETGQLLPRSRRYTHDAGPPSIPPIVVHSGSSDDFFNFGKPPLETPPLETDRASNPFSTPPGAPSPGALDFQPPPASHVSISASHPSSSAQPVETPQQNFSRSAVQTPAHALQPTDVNQQGRRTHILRKVNSNFEILVPGTLDVRDSHVDGSDDPDPDLEAGAKRHSRKLRKKKRLTLHGRSSNFTEEFDA
ncbi:MAG: hypothetical protein M1819_000214 [Sarea resinae]|nr:MAG: hypothetical protein M1819_000214 [Sarea resinae]